MVIHDLIFLFYTLRHPAKSHNLDIKIIIWFTIKYIFCIWFNQFIVNSFKQIIIFVQKFKKKHMVNIRLEGKGRVLTLATYCISILKWNSKSCL